MEPLVGAIVASAVAWLSVVGASLVRLPDAALPVLRATGGVSLVAIGLGVVGVPVPPWAAWAILVVGGLAALATVLRQRATS